MRRFKLFLFVPFLAIACGGAAPAPPAMAQVAFEKGGAPAAYPVQAAPAAPAPPPPAEKANAKTDAKAVKNAGPTAHTAVIIYQGELKMVADTSSIPKTIDAIIDLSENLGGHLVARKETTVQIRVPSNSFRAAMTKIEGLGTVTEHSVTADDVSEEFHDLEVQLTNLRATRTRLQEFLARAGGVADMLAVEHELERVSLDIDRIEGRLEFLRTRAAMSLISVGITAKAAPMVTPTPPPRPVALPIPWTSDVGIDSLLQLSK